MNKKMGIFLIIAAAFTFEAQAQQSQNTGWARIGEALHQFNRDQREGTIYIPGAPQGRPTVNYEWDTRKHTSPSRPIEITPLQDPTDLPELDLELDFSQ